MFICIRNSYTGTFEFTLYIYELRCDLNLQAHFLTRVHHKNLTSFVGYCDENTNMGLIYEYMANGNLARHLSGIDHTKNLSLYIDILTFFQHVSSLNCKYLAGSFFLLIIHRNSATFFHEL